MLNVINPINNRFAFGTQKKPDSPATIDDVNRIVDQKIREYNNQLVEKIEEQANHPDRISFHPTRRPFLELADSLKQESQINKE